VIFLEPFPEAFVTFELSDGVTMFRELSEDRMMEVHSFVAIRILSLR